MLSIGWFLYQIPNTFQTSRVNKNTVIIRETTFRQNRLFFVIKK